MAKNASGPLARAENGVTGPLYFDRQVVRAEDLTLGRTAAAAEMARIRRFLHGWGVAAGFIPQIEGDMLHVSPGYGVTPMGREVYLSGALSVPAIAARVLACCGPEEAGCDWVSGTAPPRLEGEVASWLIARPVSAGTDPRPGIAEGCAHPANALHPSRSCAAVELDLICALPESHLAGPAYYTMPWAPTADVPVGPEAPTAYEVALAERRAAAARAAAIAAGQPAEEVVAAAPQAPAAASGLPLLSDVMLQMPPDVPDAEDVIVLCQILVSADGARLRSSGRRPLWPPSVLQHWLVQGAGPGVYFANARPQEDGVHEVHRLGCPATLPKEANRFWLGAFATGAQAIAAAGQVYAHVDGCAYCMQAEDNG